MDLDDWNSPTTKLLTLLNVSATKSLKRKVLDHQASPTRKQKLNKRRVEIVSPDSPVQINDDMETTEPEVGEAGQADDGSGDVGISEAVDLSDTEGVLCAFSAKCSPDWTTEPSHEQHASPHLDQSAIESVNKSLWLTSNSSFPKLGSVAVSKVEGSTGPGKMEAGSSQVYRM